MSPSPRMRRALLFCSWPLGCTLAGQAPAREWPYTMDFGPCITTTLDGRGETGFTNKAVVVRLGDDGAVAFDTELLRLSAAWVDGWLQLRGTAYDGAHGPMPRLRGHKLLEARPGPGIDHAGDLADPRPIPHGPLPKTWGAYEGLWRHGDRTVIAYRIGDMSVLESHSIEGQGDGRCLARHFEFGPATAEHRLVVLDAPAGSTPALLERREPPVVAGGANVAALAMLQWAAPVPGPVEIDVSTRGFDRLSMGGPSARDYLDPGSGTGATVRFVPGFARPDGLRVPAPAAGAPADPQALLVPKLHDGAAATSDNDRQHSVWFERRGDEDTVGRYHIDLQRAVDVSRVSTFSWQRGQRAIQSYDLYGSDADAPPDPAAAEPVAAGWRELARVRTGELGAGDLHGASVAPAADRARCRHLLLVVQGGTFLCEVDVYADRFRAAIDGGERPPRQAAAAVIGPAGCAELVVADGRLLLRVPPHAGTLRLKLLATVGTALQVAAFGRQLAQTGAPVELRPLLRGGPPRWGEPIVTKGARGADDGPFAVDTIAIPFDNRFGSRMRVCGFDFFRDGRAAITTWNGDVWVVDGIDDDLDELRWSRFATGLFDPLGLKIVDDVVYVHGRDGITRLRDINGDQEADCHECFNHDVMITSAFHEFAFDLQTDADGNFYCSKGAPVRPGGRGFSDIVPHHGTILRISKDGQRLDVIATGLRAPNGIGVSPDGIVTSGDNEGTYMPRCRLNWITAPGFYAGVKDTAHRSPVPDQPDLPLCWLPMEVDNSSGGQVWVTSDRWAPLQGRLLHLSYGTCSVYLVLKEDQQAPQGGVVRLPCEFSSSAMRARFHPRDGQLYVAGFQGWQTSAAREGGFHRVRYTGKPLRLPVGLKTCTRGVCLEFAEPLDPVTATDPTSYGVEIWNYLYSQNYGSPELSILHPERKVEQGKPNRDPLTIESAQLSADHRTVFLTVAAMQPAMQMRITYNVDAADGGVVKGEVHNSIHALSADPGFGADRR